MTQIEEIYADSVGLIMATKYNGPKEQSDAARSFATPPADLVKLAKSEYSFVRVHVAANPNTPLLVLSDYAGNELHDEHAWEVAAALASNPSADADCLIALFTRICDRVEDLTPRSCYPARAISALGRRPDCPLRIVSELANHDVFPAHIRGRLADAATTPKLLRLLLEDRSERVRARALKALEGSASS